MLRERVTHEELDKSLNNTRILVSEYFNQILANYSMTKDCQRDKEYQKIEKSRVDNSIKHL